VISGYPTLGPGKKIKNAPENQGRIDRGTTLVIPLTPAWTGANRAESPYSGCNGPARRSRSEARKPASPALRTKTLAAVPNRLFAGRTGSRSIGQGVFSLPCGLSGYSCFFNACWIWKSLSHTQR